MNNFRYKLAQFFYGRNGLDALGYAIIALSFLVLIVNMIFNTIWLTALSYAILVLMLFRFLSKNLTQRRKENAVFLKIWGSVKSFFKQGFRRLKDIRKYRYRKCPNCKVTMRLPIKRGKNTVVCPKCKTRVKVRVWL